MLWYFGMLFEGKVNVGENVLMLVCLLYLMFVLSGFFYQVVKKLIVELELFDCELFGGIVGWCDVEGNGEWVVMICCVKLYGNQVCLFVGVGIVFVFLLVGEWWEIGVKFFMMLNVFGLY